MSALLGFAFLLLSSVSFLAAGDGDTSADKFVTVVSDVEMTYEARREMIDCLRGCRREDFATEFQSKWSSRERELILEIENIPIDNPMRRTAIFNIAFVSTETTVDKLFDIYAPTGINYGDNMATIYTYIQNLNYQLKKYAVQKYAEVGYWKSLETNESEKLRYEPEEISTRMLEILALWSREDEKTTILDKYSRFTNKQQIRHCGTIRRYVEINHNNVYGTALQSNRVAAKRWKMVWNFVKSMDTIYPDIENFLNGIDTNWDVVQSPDLAFDPFAQDRSSNYKTLWYIALSKKPRFSAQPVGTITRYSNRAIVRNDVDPSSIEKFAVPIIKLSGWALVSAQSGPRNEIFFCPNDQMSISDLVGLFQRARMSSEKYINSIDRTDPVQARIHREINEYYDSVVSWLQNPENTGGGNFISEKTKPFEKFKEEARSMGFPMYQVNFTKITEEDLRTFENVP